MVAGRRAMSNEGFIHFFPALAISALIVLAKGNGDIAYGWNSLLSAEFPRYCWLVNQPAAIGSIGWSTMEGLTLSASLLNGFPAVIIYVPLKWIATWALSIIIIGHLITNDSLTKNYYSIFLFQSLAVFPPFILGWDFGRWLVLINVTSLAWVMIFKERNDSGLNFHFIDRYIDSSKKMSPTTPFFYHFSLQHQFVFGVLDATLNRLQ